MASGNMKIIKRRIKSVGSTMQITKAMELVASAKLRNARKKAKAARPYFDAQVRMLTEISGAHAIDTAFAAYCGCKEKPNLYIVIAGDRGLAGGYNSSIFKKVLAEIEKDKTAAKEAGVEDLPQPKVIAIGKKAVEFFEKRNFDVIAKYIDLAENVKSGRCAAIANSAIKMFLDHEVDEVKLFYTRFVSSMTQQAEVMPLLPMPLCPTEIGGPIRDEMTEKVRKATDVTYDPSPQAVFNRIVPCFLMSVVQCAVTESYTSEQCARRIAMESASDNAEEMIESLSLLYNRARQEKITNEINEIVGGANAL